MRSGLIAFGTVLSAERGDFHMVEIDGSAPRRVLARRCGRMVLKKIHIVLGDRVRLDLCPVDPRRGRIIGRLS